MERDKTNGGGGGLGPKQVFSLKDFLGKFTSNVKIIFSLSSKCFQVLQKLTICMYQYETTD